MKLQFSVICFPLMLLASCQHDTMVPLQRAVALQQNMQYIQYRYVAFWPNPVGTIDTLSGTVAFRRTTDQSFGYDYVGTSSTYDITYIDNKYQQINHKDSVVLIYTDEELKKRQLPMSGNMMVMFSPLTLLNKKGWSHQRDTVIGGNALAEYRLIDMDTTIGENKIKVELHVYVDVSEAVLNHYERRAFLNGESSQTITYKFLDYVLGDKTMELSYRMPEGYITKMNTDHNNREPLKEGQPSPDFTVTDIDGNNISLKSFRGRKVLLDFSVINCGYCKLALDHLNRDGYELSGSVTGIYINPEDSRPRMLDYRAKIGIPFPVLAEEKSLANAYGVSAFPTFFLIDEQGIIEKVVLGYRPEFLESLTAIKAN